MEGKRASLAKAGQHHVLTAAQKLCLFFYEVANNLRELPSHVIGIAVTIRSNRLDEEGT